MERKVYIDNLRLICILFLFPYHAAMAWNCWGESNYILLGTNRIISSFVVAVSPWYMPLLFLLAGISTKHSLTKRSSKQYLKERSFKLLLPLLTGTFIVMPFMTYIADKVNCGYTGNYFEHYAIFFGKWTDLTGYDGGFSIGHLWFLLYLYIISIFSMIIINIQKKHINSSNKKINIFFIILLLIIAMLFMPVELGGKSILTYWFLFLFGYYIFSEEIQIENLKNLKYLYIIIFLLSTFLNIYLFLWSDLEYDLINILAKYLSGAFGIITIIIFSKYFLNKYNKITRYLISCSFLIYIFHFIWVILFQYYLSSIIINDFILFTMSVIFSFIITITICKIVKHMPVMRILFGIK